MRWLVVVVMVGLFWHGAASCGPMEPTGEGLDGEGSKPDLAFLNPPDEPVRLENLPSDFFPEKVQATKFVLKSSAFKDGKTIPGKYGCEDDGNFIKPSIPLSWEGTPKDTKSFVIVMDDLTPDARQWVHWVVFNLPATTSLLKEGASPDQLPKGSKELKNSWQVVGYGGPCPPVNNHFFRIRIFAMPKETIELIPHDNSGSIVEQLSENLGVAELRGSYPE